MMPVVRISDATFSDLKSISKWLETDTPSQTIDQLVQEMMDKLGLERDVGDGQESEADVLRFEKVPGLSFTRLISAKVDGKPVRKPNWAKLLLDTVVAVKERGRSGKDLVRELKIPARPVVYEMEGYKFDRTLGISIQGQSAADAWKEIDRLAKKWRVPVEIEFQWRDNPKAQHPGRTGTLRTGM